MRSRGLTRQFDEKVFSLDSHWIGRYGSFSRRCLARSEIIGPSVHGTGDTKSLQLALVEHRKMLVRADIINREEAPLSFEYGDVQAGAVNDDPAVLADLTQGPDIHETWHL